MFRVNLIDTDADCLREDPTDHDTNCLMENPKYTNTQPIPIVKLKVIGTFCKNRLNQSRFNSYQAGKAECMLSNYVSLGQL